MVEKWGGVKGRGGKYTPLVNLRDCWLLGAENPCFSIKFSFLVLVPVGIINLDATLVHHCCAISAFLWGSMGWILVFLCGQEAKRKCISPGRVFLWQEKMQPWDLRRCPGAKQEASQVEWRWARRSRGLHLAGLLPTDTLEEKGRWEDCLSWQLSVPQKAAHPAPLLRPTGLARPPPVTGLQTKAKATRAT